MPLEIIAPTSVRHNKITQNWLLHNHSTQCNVVCLQVCHTEQRASLLSFVVLPLVLVSKWPQAKETSQVFRNNTLTLIKTWLCIYFCWALACLLPFFSTWVWHVWPLCCLIISRWNSSPQHQLRWAHGYPHASPSCRHDSKQLLERPCYPSAQVQEQRGAPCLFTLLSPDSF